MGKTHRNIKNDSLKQKNKGSQKKNKFSDKNNKKNKLDDDE